MNRCQHCGAIYAWERSSSRWLKMTYCSVFCELGALGYTLEGFLAMEREPEGLDAETLRRLLDYPVLAV